MTKYIGLDLSLTSTGFFVLENGKEVESKLIKIKSEGRKKEKEIRLIRDLIMKEVIKYPKKTTKIMIEDFAYGILFMKINGKPICNSVFELGGLGYAVRIKLLEFGYDFGLVPPTVLKKYACGVGNCKKEMMLKEAYKQYKMDFKSNDICDAFWLAKYAEEIMK